MNYKVNVTNLFTFSYDIINLISDYPHIKLKEGFFIEVDDERLSEELSEKNEKIHKLFFE